MKRPLFIPLDPEYASDDRVCELSVTGEWMFLRLIALSFRLMSDGHVTPNQIRRETADKIDTTERDTAIKELVESGLMVATDSGFLLPGYTKNNRSAGEIGDARLRKKVGSDLGVHNRWHENDAREDCEFCKNPDASFTSVMAMHASSMPKASLRHIPRQCTDTDTDTEPYTDTDTDTEPTVASSEALTLAPSGQIDVLTDAETIFQHWRSKMSPKSRFTPERKRVINARLKDGYQPHELIEAIDGCALSPFHMGENPRHTRYDKLTLIMRNAEMVDQFRRFYQTPPKPKSNMDEAFRLSEFFREIDNDPAPVTTGRGPDQNPRRFQ